MPAKPTITKDVSGNLLSSATSGNQWYLSGVAISGATGTSYKPSADGIISVKVTQNGCVSIVSDNFTYVITAIANFENGQYIKFYPNPVQNELKINFNLIGQSNISIKIFNYTGKLILANDKISSGANINLKSLIIGTYIVQVQDKNGKLVFTDKLIKE
ncbi:MAG: T9SS type A sorting domain-containing protein [Bacteroidetes bacterium]|nr:T9SS type A sorting domain-containing protein [Bacteroidota bacterium]